MFVFPDVCVSYTHVQDFTLLERKIYSTEMFTDCPLKAVKTPQAP
jgi:hypothetical protein